MGCRCYERLQPNTKEFTRLAIIIRKTEGCEPPCMISIMGQLQKKIVLIFTTHLVDSFCSFVPVKESKT